jgi:hypothetical protein
MWNKAAIKELSNNPSKIEQAYSIIDSALNFVTSELGLVALSKKDGNFIYVFKKLKH